MSASVEIVDSRFQDWRIKLADTVADLASNGAAAVSSRVVPLADVDTRLVGMALSRNGEVIDTGAGAAALGDPIAVVAWLANTLGENGIALEPGHLVMTGRCTRRCRWQPARSTSPSSTGSAPSPCASSTDTGPGHAGPGRPSSCCWHSRSSTVFSSACC